MIGWEDEAAIRAQALIARSFQLRLGAQPNTRHPHYLLIETLVAGVPTIAACSYISFAHEQQLFSEVYFSNPIQREVVSRLNVDVNRSAICEIGGLSTDPSHVKSVRDVVAYFPWFAGQLGYQYALVTVTSYMRLAFQGSGTNFQAFRKADGSCISPEEKARWGRYYDFDPQSGVIDLKQMDFLNEAARSTNHNCEFQVELGSFRKVEACS